MAMNCIVCGKPAGSGEHVFPAAMGGRRINRKIYCTEHDNGYSDLVAELANQMDVFNAHLGVIPDHGNVEKSVVGTEPGSGLQIKVAASKAEFVEPRLFSQEDADGETIMHMGFPNHESIKKWVEEQESKGVVIKRMEKGTSMPYIVDGIHYRRRFGGPCGLGAVAYVTQTHLAQEFPELARSEALADFIAYTQAISKFTQRGGCRTQEEPEGADLTEAREALAKALEPWGGEPPIWWDMAEQPDPSPNTFTFGHRVTVGVDAEDGQIFGRLTFFSALSFSMVFGKAEPGGDSKTVTIDIDPLAEYAKPDHDTSKTEAAIAIARVARPHSPADELYKAIHGGDSVFDDLMRRLTDHALARLAKKMHWQIAAAPGLSRFEFDNLIAEVVGAHAQQVWKTTQWVLLNSKSHFPEPLRSQIGPALDMMVARDPNSANGLSQTASAVLELAKAALIDQMQRDHAADLLDERRIAELMGEGPGAAIIGSLVFSVFTGQPVGLEADG